jgi:two-component system sensor histidine kinase/response regulator
VSQIIDRVDAPPGLDATRALLAAIVESSDDAIISTALDRTILTWNAGATALYGYEAGEVLGRNASFLVPAERREEMADILRRIANGADVRHVETIRLRRDGSRVPVAIAVWPLRDFEGRLIGIATLAHDITERLRLREEVEAARDEALSALRAKSQFLANTSHELRTPLTSIIGMTELLMRTELDGDQQKMADAVKRSAEQLRRTIIDILDVSELTNGNLDIHVGEVDVRRLVEEVAQIIRPSAGGKGLELVHGVDHDTPAVVYGDRGRLRQMLLHLARNAVKFTDRGGIVIRASRPEHVEVPSVRFTVIDTGIGVAPRDHWRLFRVFSQVDPTDTRRFGGNGLGLALVAQLAEVMGGSVGVASASGRGSTFWFDIPAVPPDQPGS